MDVVYITPPTRFSRATQDDSDKQQPGTIFNNLGAVQQVGRSLLGVVALVATLVVMFYTTASDTMVRPKLQFSKWEKMDLNSTVWASYANPKYVNDTCTTPISVYMDPLAAGESCLAIQYSGDCEFYITAIARRPLKTQEIVLIEVFSFL